MCGTPLDDAFNEEFWAHYVKDFDFNELFDKAV